MEYDKANRLISYNGESIKYDKDGNMTYGPLAGVMTTFTYDCRNRLVQAGDTKYEYDAEDTRIAVQTKDTREEYVTNKEATYSQTLCVTTFEKNVLGLFSKEVDTTTKVTDEGGKIAYEFSYGSYGELLSGESGTIRYLYNGQFGVETDSNGLYYMRARYYNTDIRRFINQDILTGSIDNSQSLNRYCFVQGNPISYTDPFGLCPQNNGSFSSIGHTVLDVVGLIPGFGDVADVINGVWYLTEGNFKMAGMSFLSALPAVGSVIGSTVCMGAKASKYYSKATKTAKYIKNISKVISYTGTFAVSSVNLKYDVTEAIKEYKSTRSVSLGSAINIIADGIGIAASGGGLVSSGKNLRKMLKSDGVGAGIKSSLKAARCESKVAISGMGAGNKSGDLLSYDLQYFASKGAANATGTYKELVNAGQKDAHHIIQDAAMRDIEGYNRFDAPAIQLEGPSIMKGTPHNIATSI